MLCEINGYWKDDKAEFSGLVTEFDNTPEGMDDDEIFFYGMCDADIQEAIDLGEYTAQDFVITSYTVVSE